MDRSGDNWHYDMRDLIILICLKSYVTLRVEVPNSKLPLAMVGVHWSSASGDIRFLICHVTSQDHVIKRYDIMDGSPS